MRLYLPRALQHAVDLSAGTIGIPRGQGETILIVEDEAAVRMILSDALQELGYTVVEATDARPAIAVLQSDRHIDLLISDVVLPHVNGRKLAEMARGWRPELTVLFVTGYAEHAAARNEFLETGMDLLMKPFAFDVLATKVRAMIER